MQNRSVRVPLRGVGLWTLGSVLALSSGAFAQEAGGATNAIPPLWWIAPVGSIIALVFAMVLYKNIMGRSEGDDAMKEIAAAVRSGAYAYLRQQYKIVLYVFCGLFLLLFIVAFALKYQSRWVPFAFLTGGFFSGLCGWLGMKTATNASARTAQAAKESLNAGLQVALRAGAVMGLVVVGFGLLDICLWFLILYKLVPVLGGTPMSLAEITVTMLCFGMGASTQALFARVGGGIFTKSADVGADLVGKVEAGIPEDDPRNPATIADNVGDNVGDVAGMGADLYESYCGSILSTAALGVAAAVGDFGLQVRLLATPMVIAGIGCALSVLGVYAVRSGEKATQRELLGALGRGVNLSSLGILLASAAVVHFLLPGHFGIFGSIVAGLGAGILIGKATEYYTSDEYKPTQYIADQALTGPATVIISGIATGMQSTAAPVIIVSVGTLFAYGFAGGFGSNPQSMAWGLYGIGIAAVGMLSTLGITLATDAYGPIADNAGGNAEMTHQEPHVRERTDALDSLGNTTAATGKGFAIGSAALTALALLAAYIEEVRIGMERVALKVGEGTAQMLGGGHDLIARGGQAFMKLGDGWNDTVAVKDATLSNFMEFYSVHLMNPKVLVGMLLGSMMVFFFCALTMQAVGRAAGAMVDEVRRQFREIPGIMEGTAKPDYAQCVQIATRGAQREMVVPSLLAIAVPLATGVILGVPGVAGLLVAGTSTGFAFAIMMANAGGAWDNAKKYIERGAHGGKGSEAHKAGVVGDTVGDPFKDTSGPSLNILIKLMSMVAVVFAGVTVAFGPVVSKLLGM
jgi:K(+)-stimulated pyrophosphate-energized sodium pump